MPSTTSRVHPRTVSSVLRLVADWTAGIWDSSSRAFTIPTGLAGRRTTTLSSLPAFRTCYGPPCLSAQGQSRDLQHLSPMLARCGNIALRDIAHVLICPIQTDKPHDQVPPCLNKPVPGTACPSTLALKARLSNDRFSRNIRRRRGIFFNRSNRVGRIAFRLPRSLFTRVSLLSFWPFCQEGLLLVYCRRGRTDVLGSPSIQLGTHAT